MKSESQDNDAVSNPLLNSSGSNVLAERKKFGSLDGEALASSSPLYERKNFKVNLALFIIGAIIVSLTTFAAIVMKDIATTGDHGPVITLQNGSPVKGYTYISNYSDIIIEAWKGIPYAEPPVGDKRWKAPTRKQPWISVLDTTKLKPMCVH